MNQTPEANIPHITLFGQRNAGKSSLLNAMLNQTVSIVSEKKGTTTDPVKKRMELIPYGPVVFIDTAGIDDIGTLGQLRVDMTKKMMQKTDLALIIIDVLDYDTIYIDQLVLECKKYHTPYKIVFNKIDLLNDDEIILLKKEYEKASFVSTFNPHDMNNLKEVIIKNLKQEKEEPIIGDLLNYNSTVVLVVPIDSEAPKGRIILPQVQVIRDCLDYGIKCHVVRDTELESAINELNKIDLVITDSQAFKKVNQIVPNDIYLTSFSILFARYKGDIDVFIEDVKTLKTLTDNANILIAESCSHNVSHEDIGRYKIPNLINQKMKINPTYHHVMGQDFPSDLSPYDLIIHCGNCMFNKKTMASRIKIAKAYGVPITNYGIVLAYLNGILERSIEILNVII